MQVPYHDTRSLRAVEKYMGAHRWDGCINLGDFVDLNELSGYVKGKPGAIVEDLADTFDEANEILDRHVALVRKRNRKARFVLLQGNHEYRAMSFGEEHVGLGRHVDVARNLRLKERGIQWVKSWEKGTLFRLGHARFLHGRFINKHHAHKMADMFGVSVYYGHTHDVMLYPKAALGNDKTYEAGSLGCLCRYNQRYLKGGPTNWQQAFATLFLMPDGFYNIYISRLFKHRFVGPDGRIYDGRRG
jgi:hypothetical protein